MNVSSVTTFGSAAIASPPANNNANAKPDRPETAPAQQPVEAAKPEGTGKFVDIKV